jgi:hypothetical protein
MAASMPFSLLLVLGLFMAWLQFTWHLDLHHWSYRMLVLFSVTDKRNDLFHYLLHFSQKYLDIILIIVFEYTGLQETLLIIWGYI